MKERALRYNSNKAELFYPLTFPEALRGISRVSSYGANKYTVYNYMKGAPASESVGSAIRHLLAWWNGEDIDPESNLNHLDHFAWNAARLTNEMLGDNKEELDDRPHKVIQKELTSLFAVDLDGCFANFSQAFIEQAEKMGMADHFPSHWTTIPDWGFGADPNKWSEVWNDIEGNLDFWVNLEVMQELPFTPLAYVTARPFKHISEAWLFKHNFPNAPVITVNGDKNKVQVLQEIGAEVYIDDKFENYKMIKDAGITCFLQDRPWNSKFEAGEDRVLSVEEAIKRLTNLGK